METVRTILIPVDFSPHSRRAVEYAVALARSLGSQIHLVHSLHLPDELRVTGEWWGTLRERASLALSELLAELDRSGVKSQTHLSDEEPSAAILQIAGQLHPDLIVMGTRGHTGLPHVFLGSVTERTLRLAPCPVLTVKQPEEEERES